MALCDGSTNTTSAVTYAVPKNLKVASWLTQYEFKTLKLGHRLPTRSSATERRERCGLSCDTPWLTGFPNVAPFLAILFRFPLRTRTR